MKRTDDLTWVLKKSEWNYQIQVPNCFAMQNGEGHWSFWNPRITPCATNPGNLADPTQIPATRQKTRGLLRIVCRKFLMFSILTRRWYIPILQQITWLGTVGTWKIPGGTLQAVPVFSHYLWHLGRFGGTSWQLLPRLQMVPWKHLFKLLK